ncbi:hypothetical protein CEXT_65071 [Caerostris extrusa]|uniref:Uncharacterized protein n=1 Tax=Caerostris extrusa TaxID=172846 RepID=A0AAV4WF72_CAEEX|nr:hypothetical protein CEXT_65071 [Caerostris extrusa]
MGEAKAEPMITSHAVSYLLTKTRCLSLMTEWTGKQNPVLLDKLLSVFLPIAQMSNPCAGTQMKGLCSRLSLTEFCHFFRSLPYFRRNYPARNETWIILNKDGFNLGETFDGFNRPKDNEI